MTPDIDLDAPTLDELLDEYGSAHVEYWTAVDDSPFEADAKKRRTDAAAAIGAMLDEAESALTAARAELDGLQPDLTAVMAQRDEALSVANRDVAVAAEVAAARHDVEYWKGKYEAGVMDQMAAAPQPDEPTLCPKCSHRADLHSGPGKPRCWVAKCHCKLNRPDAITAAIANSKATGAGDGEQDTATTERVGPMPAGGWPCANCGTRGMDCIDEMNRDASLRRCCGTCGLADAHGDTASVQGAADGEVQA